MSTTEILVIVAAIAGLLLVTVVPILLAIWLIRRLAGGSRAQRERGDHLVATGRKARARIVGIAPTGMIVNEINIRCLVSFQITPLHGGPAFDGQKKMLINQTQMPRVGDEWPCWFDAVETTQFAVGQPGADARETVEVFREFGIAHPLDR